MRTAKRSICPGDIAVLKDGRHGFIRISMRLCHSCPALRSDRALQLRIPTAPPLPSTGAAAGRPALFIGFPVTIYYGRV